MTTEAQRQVNNKSRLNKISPSIRNQIVAILDELQRAGYYPQIDAQVWRSAAQQAKLKAEGKSTVSYSFHNVSTSSGDPDSLAADIVDVRWQWNAPKHYWLRLAAAAERQGLTTGIYWGLSQSKRNAIRKAIKDQNWSANIELGWDTAHVEPANFSLSKARAGERPELKPVPKPQPMRLFLRTNQRATTQVESAYFQGGKWYVAEEVLARLLGASTQYPSRIQPVSTLLDNWGWVLIKYTPNEEQNRADIYVVTKSEAESLRKAGG